MFSIKKNSAVPSRKKASEVFLPLEIKTLRFSEINEYQNSKNVILSFDRKYICLMGKPFVQSFQTVKTTIKLYNIEKQLLLKQFEDSNFFQECEFSQDSKVFLLLNNEFTILFYIEKEKEIKINTKETIFRISFDSLKYMCITEDQIQIYDSSSKMEFQNSIINSKWDFSKQQHFLMSFSKKENLFSLQYYRISKQAMKLVSNEIHFEMDCIGNKFDILEFLENKLVVIFKQDIIKIYSLGGKLIRKISSQSYNSIKMKKDINNKCALVTIAKERQLVFGPTKHIEYLSILPEIKTQIFELMDRKLMAIEKLTVFFEVDEQLTGEIHFLD